MSGAKGKGLRPTTKMISAAGTGHTHVARKNRHDTPDRLMLYKFDPVVCRHVEYKESR